MHMKSKARKAYKRITSTIINYPAASFFGVLGVLFALIIIGSILSKPKTTNDGNAKKATSVAIHSIGSAPRVTMTAQVETSGVVKITAQTSGIVQQLYAREGSRVSRGDWLFWLSTNYQGGTVPTVTRQIAQKNYDFVVANYDLQKSLIDRQKSIADTVQTQGGEVRTITNNSIADSKSLIELDQQIVDSLDAQITQLEQSNSGGSNNALILQAKQGRAGAQAGINSLKVALATAEYQSSPDQEPAQLSTSQHDLTIAQLELQQKSLDLNRELSLLNLRVAQISEALMYPASPVAGVVERVYVQPGQSVTSGTLLATITGDKKASTVVLSVPESTAKSMSRIEPSVIFIGSRELSMTPTYISTQPTDGALYTVIYRVPAEYESDVSAGSTVRISVPIGGNASTGSVPVIPIDALYQTESASFVYVASQSAQGTFVAKSMNISLGKTFGSFVEVVRGITHSDHVIVTRTVIDGDVVEFK